MLQSKPARTGKRRTRFAAAATSTALVAGVGGLVLAGAPAANAANVNLDKRFNYTCKVDAGALPLGNHVLGVRAQVQVPSVVNRNQTLPTRKTTITLTLPETLREATYDILRGRTAGGESKDAKVSLSAPGSSTLTVGIANLRAAQAAVPATAGAPWNIATVGDVPAIKVPATAHTRASFSMPAAFSIAATVINVDDVRIGVTLACKTAGSRVIGSVAINKNASKVAAKVSPKKIKAKKTKAKIAVTVSAGSPKASGKVTAKIGKKTVGKGTVKNGKATIKLKKFKKKGTYKIKVTYGGSAYAKGSTKTIKVKVRK
ncbi:MULTISPECIES: DUF6801 domain-containing protein [Mumia]|uniref:DUF6801 domain-containing protein n=1 Tax=Mumia TaxID=1546255 RepID=UPI001420A399|nr:DUF6801 domain-containing protein [Mumia sp. ZJ1417]QMW66546.1 Ig-like domain repeat protein [Mumia sp. ZJ1417]